MIHIKRFVKQAITEDNGRGDLFYDIAPDGKFTAKIVSKSNGILAGVKYAETLAQTEKIKVDFLKKDGEIATIYALEEWFKTTGAHARDCEDALDMIMSMQIVQVAFFIRFTNGACRVSLRSKNELDVSKIASIFDGGGHFNASGCTIDTKDVEVAKNLVLKEVIKYYG